MSSRTDGIYSDNRAAGPGGKRGGQIRANTPELRIPSSLMAHDGVKYDEQLAHARRKRDLRFLAGGTQTKIERLQYRVPASCHQCAHVKHGTAYHCIVG